MHFPRFVAVADHAVLVEFAEALSEEAYAQVRHLDAVLAAAPPPGFREAVPAFVNILLLFDPVLTDHAAMIGAAQAALLAPTLPQKKPASHDVDVCYEGDFAPDLDVVAAQTGLSREEVITRHLGGDYRVYLYGFSPGYAYLAGVPEALRLPRKPAALRNIAAGSVIIAGPQCLVTTLTMPTGWWIIGRSPTAIILDDPARPFRFAVGDQVRFRRISRADFARQALQPGGGAA